MIKIDAAFAGNLDGHCKMFLDAFLLFFQIKILVLRRHITPFASRCLNEAILLQRVIGFFAPSAH